MSNINLGSYATLALDNIATWDSLISKNGVKVIKKESVIPSDIIYLPTDCLKEIVNKLGNDDKVKVMKLKEHLKNQKVAEKIKNEIKLKEEVTEKKVFISKLPKLGKDTINFIMEFLNFLKKENINKMEWINLLIKCVPDSRVNSLLKEKEKYIGVEPSLEILKKNNNKFQF
jgi:hypothetical protein